MKIAPTSAAYPPNLDGIGDYTWWLAGALARASPVSVFTRSGKHISQDGVTVVPVFDPANLETITLLPEALIASGFGKSGDSLVFQYNPFSWGKRGFCPAVPRTLREVKRQLPEIKIAIMFHETTVPCWPWRFTIMRTWQRPVFRALCHLSDVSFASSERYVQQIKRIGANAPIHHLPVGSNLAASALSCEEARQELNLPGDGVYIGVFGSAHESRLLDWIATAFHSIQGRYPQAKLLYVGPHGESISRALGGRHDLIDLGIQPADRAGICISAMDLLLAPFNDGISTRRGSAIAAFQNGVPVASTTTNWTDTLFTEKPLRSILLSSATNAGEFAKEAASWTKFLDEPQIRQAFREEVKEFHDENFSWAAIAKKLTTCIKESA